MLASGVLHGQRAIHLEPGRFPDSSGAATRDGDCGSGRTRQERRPQEPRGSGQAHLCDAAGRRASGGTALPLPALDEARGRE